MFLSLVFFLLHYWSAKPAEDWTLIMTFHFHCCRFGMFDYSCSNKTVELKGWDLCLDISILFQFHFILADDVSCGVKLQNSHQQPNIGAQPHIQSVLWNPRQDERSNKKVNETHPPALFMHLLCLFMLRVLSKAWQLVWPRQSDSITFRLQNSISNRNPIRGQAQSYIA